MRLNRLEIEALRGIPRGWPSIDVGEKGLVVYGPNGSGKSSIIDGIEDALDKECSLFAEKRQGVNWDKGGEHIGGGPKRAELFGTIGGKEFNLTTLVDAPEEVVSWKNAANSSVFVLRRHMLLNFIMSQPADRYGSLEGFFNLRDYATLETAATALLNSAQSVEGGLEVSEQAQTQKLRLRLGLSEGVPPTPEAAENYLAERLKACGMAAASSSEDRAERRKQATEELAGIAADTRLTQLAQLKGRVQELLPSSTYDQMLGQLSDLQNAYTTARAESTSVAPAEFLKTAQDIIQKNSLNECPVCEQTINPSLTSASLQARIEKDAKVSAALLALKQHHTTVKSTIMLHASAFKAVVAGYEKLFGEELPKPYQDERNLLDQFLKAFHSDGLIDNLTDLRSALKATVASHEPILTKINAEVAGSGASRRTLLAELLDALGIVETDLDSLRSTQLHLEREKQKRMALERVAGHILRARRATVQKIVDRLAALANEFYEFIHPGEEISQSSLEVRQVGKGSVDISTSFHGNIEHPLLHFSESHLDTLGLCYFLAARRLEADGNPSFKLLVLDDVVHSVDADHRDRIARLLSERFGDHQIVIVTHDSVFYQRIRQIFGSKYEYIYFTNWSLEAGPVRIQSSTDIDRITSTELRNSMSQDELAAACGRFSEWLFMQLDERLQVAVQARFSRPHDIGNLWPPLAAKLKKQRAFESKAGIVDRIDGSQWVRNKVGAHYNEPESPVTPKEVRELAEALDDLFTATFCEKCRNTIAKVDDKTWSCECGALKYSPAPAEPQPA